MTPSRPSAADMLSATRLAVAPVLPLVATRRRLFLALVTTSAVTDAVDGQLARRGGTAGARGALLDSVADAAFLAGLVAACIRVRPERSRALGPAVAGVTAVRAAAALVGILRWGRPVLLHTWSNKAAGACAIVGLTGLTAFGRRGRLATGTALIVAAGAAVEELCQLLTSAGPPDVDAPGVLGSLASRLVGRRRGDGTTLVPRPMGCSGSMYLDVKINRGRRRARQRSRAEKEST